MVDQSPEPDSGPAPVDTGLDADQVAERVRQGRVNRQPDGPSRSLSQIITANTLTPVNLIIGTLFLLIMVAAPGPDALFAGVVVSNSLLGIIQEVRAKRTLDQLALLNAPRTRVVRQGTIVELPLEQVVEDDLIELHPGDQIVVDADVLDAQGLEVDESLLTGEADPVDKQCGDAVLSGSFVVAGSGRARATRVGGASYAASLAEEARRFQLVNSELRAGINLILRWLTWIIPPVSLLLMWRLLQAEDDWREALRGTVAAAVAMVPDGLVLLTSLSMIVGVLALARRRALAKELASVELLARVDVLCLDKTGTITTGRIAYAGIRPLGSSSPDEIAVALAALAAADPTPNPTMAAIADTHSADPGWSSSEAVPFSSARKWSATSFGERGTWFLGAPEVLLAATSDGVAEVRTALSSEASQGRRVVMLAWSPRPPRHEQLPEDLSPLALVLLEDEVRHDAPEILGFFRQQGLSLKVISGDHPVTVAAVARRAGIPGADEGVDARELPLDGDELADRLDQATVFGRVVPHQKRAMVGALQSRGHVVAMTGDGVNDVLALKDADMGIAMGSGSAATRSVAQLVLLDDSFATLPRVLAEGRRVINNIERVANLFVVKATYAVLLAAAIGLAGIPFPFLPRHLTLVGSVSIGIPGFFLALYPAHQRAAPGFITRVLRYSLPAGTVAATTTFVVYLLLRADETVSLDQARTGATLTLLGVGLVILAHLARPLTPSKAALVVAMGLSYVVCLNVEFLSSWFALDMPPVSTWWWLGAAMSIGGLAVLATSRLTATTP